GTRTNIENLTRSFFSGDVEDRERLVRVLKKAQITPSKIETIYSSWFDGNYPEDDGVDIYNKVPKKVVEGSDSDPDKFIEDMAIRDRIAQKDRMIALQTKKRELEIQKEIKELAALSNDAPKSKELLEPIMITDNEGNIEVATDKEGNPITRRIVEPIGSGGGESSSLASMMMMQKIIGSDKPKSDDGMLVIRIQSLEAEITRLKERNDYEIDRHRDLIANKDKEILSIKDGMSKELSHLKEANLKNMEQMRENHAKELSDMQKRYDDKIENIEQRHFDNIAAINDRHQAINDRMMDKMERIESDAAGSVEGLRFRHHEELSRLHADYKQQLSTFSMQSRSDLDSVKTMHQLESVYRNNIDAVNREHDINMKALEKKIADNANMSVAEKQNDKIIEAVSSGIGSAFEAFGKPYAANMQTSQMINQKRIAEDAMAQRQAKIAEMRRNGYSEQDIAFVVDGNSSDNNDAVYEQVLQDEDDLIPVESGIEQYKPEVTPITPTMTVR
ncbi:MAG: hypothetical protein ACTSYJ_04795, partial [Candidatus Thorarchaeota archaeon]